VWNRLSTRFYHDDDVFARRARQEFYRYKEGAAPFLVDDTWRRAAEELEPWQWWARCAAKGINVQRE